MKSNARSTRLLAGITTAAIILLGCSDQRSTLMTAPPIARATGDCDATTPQTATIAPDGNQIFVEDAPKTFTVTVYDMCGHVMSSPPNAIWSTSTTGNLAIVGSANGTVLGKSVTIRGVSVGPATLIFSSLTSSDGVLPGNGITVTSNFSVESRQVVRMSVQPSTIVFAPGEQQAISVKQYNSSGSEVSGSAVTLSSTNTGVATAAMGSATSGTVTAVGQGTAQITASNGSQSATVDVTVGTPRGQLTSFSVSPLSADVNATHPIPLTATAKDFYGAALAVSWSSANPAVATVDANGVVTGALAGITSVTASIQGQSIAVPITVHPNIRASGVTYFPIGGTGMFAVDIDGCVGSCTIHLVRSYTTNTNVPTSRDLGTFTRTHASVNLAWINGGHDSIAITATSNGVTGSFDWFLTDQVYTGGTGSCPPQQRVC
jgi:hypothetical protein